MNEGSALAARRSIREHDLRPVAAGELKRFLSMVARVRSFDPRRLPRAALGHTGLAIGVQFVTGEATMVDPLGRMELTPKQKLLYDE